MKMPKANEKAKRRASSHLTDEVQNLVQAKTDNG